MYTTISPSFIEIRWKTKVLLIAHFSVQNFKVSVESWKSYIVTSTGTHHITYVLHYFFQFLAHCVIPVLYAGRCLLKSSVGVESWYSVEREKKYFDNNRYLCLWNVIIITNETTKYIELNWNPVVFLAKYSIKNPAPLSSLHTHYVWFSWFWSHFFLHYMYSGSCTITSKAKINVFWINSISRKKNPKHNF